MKRFGPSTWFHVFVWILFTGHLSPAATQAPASEIVRNKEVVRLYINELWNNLRYELVEEILSPDLVSHASDGSVERGNQRFRQVIPLVRQAFPDLNLIIEEMVAEGDRVALRLRITGTHQGEFAGIAPTNNRVDVPEWFFIRLADGKIVETWYLRDQQMLLQQLTGK